MKYQDFVNDNEERCYQCGCEEFELNVNTTLYHCIKCGTPADDIVTSTPPKQKTKSKVKKFKDKKAA